MNGPEHSHRAGCEAQNPVPAVTLMAVGLFRTTYAL